MRAGGEIERAVDRGLRFLEATQHEDGRWEDFGIAGLSDMWTTAFVGTMVAEVDTPDARRMAGRAFEWLRAAGHQGRWAYSADAPDDADSTTWVSRLALRLGMSVSPQTRRFLREHVQEDGALATFVSDDFVRKFERDTVDRSGWYTGHLCVTSPAASLPVKGLQGPCSTALDARQKPNGAWEGYWWLDDEYTTAFAVEALISRPAYRSAVAAAVAWLRSRLEDAALVTTPYRPDGSAFATALAARALSMADPRVELQASVRALADAQEPGGAWPASAALRLPYPNVKTPSPAQWSLEGTTIWDSPLWDQERLHTTATVVNALWHIVNSYASKE